jgi:hypothetical protein
MTAVDLLRLVRGAQLSEAALDAIDEQLRERRR